MRNKFKIIHLDKKYLIIQVKIYHKMIKNINRLKIKFYLIKII
jgi:hypothetical protein